MDLNISRNYDFKAYEAVADQRRDQHSGDAESINEPELDLLSEELHDKRRTKV